MPQATLLGYLVPLQPKSTQPLRELPVETRSPAVALTRVLPVSAADNSSINPIVTSRDEKTSTSTSIRAIIDPGVLGNGSLDFVVPPGQPQAAITPVLSSHIARLKTITATLLPVKYPDRLFKECLDDEIVGDLSRVLLWNSQPVGWIRCRLETDDHGLKQVYIQVIGVLAPYRGCGLAQCLLEQVTRPSLVQKFGLTSIYCHVWQSNENALEWYEKRGFKRVVLLEHYYRRLRPGGAWIMCKDLS